MERCFCPQACYKHRELRRINTGRATMQVNNLTTACTPGGKGQQEKVTVEREKEERTEGKREAQRDTMHSLNDARH